MVISKLFGGRRKGRRSVTNYAPLHTTDSIKQGSDNSFLNALKFAFDLEMRLVVFLDAKVNCGYFACVKLTSLQGKSYLDTSVPAVALFLPISGNTITYSVAQAVC